MTNETTLSSLPYVQFESQKERQQAEKVFKQVMAKNFSKFKFYETLIHIIIKLKNNSDKEKSFKIYRKNIHYIT